MDFRDNSALIRTAAVETVGANSADDVFTGTAGADAYIVENGLSGDDLFSDFGSNDSLLTRRKIFDGNNDGIIDFGPNGVLDVDRFGRGDNRAGPDQFQLVNEGADLTAVRYLGNKSGLFAYANADTRYNLIDTFTAATVKEGTVNDDTITAGAGATVILQDNALGLNLGGDTITGFGADDLFVTTRKLFDSDENEVVTFSGNGVLDVSGSTGPRNDDPSRGPGGQIDFVGIDGIAYLGENVIDGVTYYYYGTADTTVSPFAGD